MKNILIIQTAFIGDVILATSLIELVIKNEPESEIHFLLRAGNEVLLENNPHVKKVWIWNKKKKYSSLFENVRALRSHQFDYVFNLQRFFNSGLMCALLKSHNKSSFAQNPLSFFTNKKVPHQIPWIIDGEIQHEVDRNAQLLPDNWKAERVAPRLYFSEQAISPEKPFVVLAPRSVWQTKQWPLERWQQLCELLLEEGYEVHLTGAPSDYESCESIKKQRSDVINHCGKLSLHESANLMRRATRVFANDSAALHLASSVNVASTAIFCSTSKSFGFYGLSDDTVLIEKGGLECKPCGLHGKIKCPLEHFSCGFDISAREVFQTVKK